MRHTPDTIFQFDEFSTDVNDRLAVEYLLDRLTPEQQEILILHEIEELTFGEIGKIVGLKYRGKELSASAIRYHKDKIMVLLREFRTQVGE